MCCLLRNKTCAKCCRMIERHHMQHCSPLREALALRASLKIMSLKPYLFCSWWKAVERVPYWVRFWARARILGREEGFRTTRPRNLWYSFYVYYRHQCKYGGQRILPPSIWHHHWKERMDTCAIYQLTVYYASAGYWSTPYIHTLPGTFQLEFSITCTTRFVS